jgi:molybdate transport system substrate-binding protein
MVRPLVLLFTGLALAPARGEVVSIAAASDLVFCLEALHAEFAKLAPAVVLKVSIGSSGNFFAQIQNGAPYDVFLSADLNYPRALVAAKAADETSLVLYAIGRLVIWTKRPDLDLADPAAAVRDPRVQKLALANPAHAPYGRAAQQALEKLGVWTAAQPKLVLGENIAQTAQFVQTGSADAGIVALSLVLAPTLEGVGRWTQLPLSLYAPLEQGAVLTTRGAANPAARRYLAFLRTPAARSIFDRYGFRLPESP